ncbi:hypothetical protein BBJ29_008215 [Phytophthora kernoviae]|uniref:C2 domain-containing protein n=1 Tax=Phytophthora kernoviae TaxID=325452 RepID=A0A3R7N7B9_9STRA|nr:hypothetical protein BBJ29_008215 [Phytophthora kernoviae]
MKVLSLGLVLCAALAVTTELSTSVAASSLNCKTPAGFVDSGDSSDMPSATTVAPTSSTGSKGSTISSAGSDGTAVQGSTNTADDDSTTTQNDGVEQDDVTSSSTSDDSEDVAASKGEAAQSAIDGNDDQTNSASNDEDDTTTQNDGSDVSDGDEATPTKGDGNDVSVGSKGDSSSVDAPVSSQSDASDVNTGDDFASTGTSTTSSDVRVQGDMPEWNADNQRFVSSYYDTFDDKYRAVVDTVNMAAVEGALKYVQAECINTSAVTDCERKNNIKYVVFYQTTVAQPVAAMDYYANATDQYDFAIEHCPFMAMDGGQCDPNPDGSFPDICNQYIGADGQPDLGFCVGGTLQDNEDIAPYPHNYWFSFPNSCPQELWDDKTDTCREEYAGGMCALGVEPDGVTCSFSYEILGYILLDDVVGITSLINPLTLTYYADYKEFCEAGGIEFAVDLLGNILSWLAGLPFWANPGDSDANAERVEKLVSAYDALVAKTPTTSDGGIMKALPTIEALQALNPPCYENKKGYGSLVIQKVESKFIRRDSRQKWFMLAILSVLSALNQGICFSYAPIASIVEERWEQRIHSTELITVYFIVYIPCSFVGSWIMDKKGLRVAHFSKAEIGLFGAAFIVSSLIGGQVISQYVDKKRNHKTSLQLCLLLTAVAIASFRLVPKVKGWNVRTRPVSPRLLHCNNSVNILAGDYLGLTAALKGQLSSSDAYAVIEVEGKKVAWTRPIFNTLEPIWNETFFFKNLNPDTVCKLYLFDKDMNVDDPLGRNAGSIIVKVKSHPVTPVGDADRLESLAYHIQLQNIPQFLPTDREWNKDYPTIQRIFSPDYPESPVLRKAIMGQHVMVYMHNQSTLYGAMESPADFFKLVHDGRRQNKQVLFTYVITKTGWYFSETGAAFFKDMLSKHMLHCGAAFSVLYAGEFRIETDLFGEPKLIIDNDSGTYAPPKEDLPRLRALFENNFPGISVEALDRDAEGQQASRKEILDSWS